MTFQTYLPFCRILVSPDALARAYLYWSLCPPVPLDDTCGRTSTLLPSRCSLQAIITPETHLSSSNSMCLAFQGFGSYISMRAPKAWRKFYTFFANSGYIQSMIQTVDVLPDVQCFHRVESMGPICEPTSSPRIVETTLHSSFIGNEGGKWSLQQTFLSTSTRGRRVC